MFFIYVKAVYIYLTVHDLCPFFYWLLVSFFLIYHRSSKSHVLQYFFPICLFFFFYFMVFFTEICIMFLIKHTLIICNKLAIKLRCFYKHGIFSSVVVSPTQTGLKTGRICVDLRDWKCGARTGVMAPCASHSSVHCMSAHSGLNTAGIQQLIQRETIRS